MPTPCITMQKTSGQQETTRRPSNGRLMYLLDRLDRMRCAVEVEQMEDAMFEFTNGLLNMRILKDGLQQEPCRTRSAEGGARSSSCITTQEIAARGGASIFQKRGDENMLQDLHVHGAIFVLLGSIRRGMGVASPEFFNSASIALIHFAFQSQERSKYIYQAGGFQVVVHLMHGYRSVEYIQIIGIAFLMVIGKHVGFSEFLLDYPILHEIVLAMEYHCESSSVYTVACSALATLFGPGSSFIVLGHDDEHELCHRAVCAIVYGLVLHLDDRTAMDTGSHLLLTMVGPNVAEEMIQDCERDLQEHNGITCVCAAAA